MKPDVRERLSESFQSAAEISGGRVIAAEMDGDAEYAFTTRYACPECDFTVGSLEPRLFSANSPVGCCPTCRGTGVSSTFLERILRDPTASLEGTALEGWGPMSGANWAKLVRLSQTAGFSLSTPGANSPKTSAAWCSTGAVPRSGSIRPSSGSSTNCAASGRSRTIPAAGA